MKSKPLMLLMTLIASGHAFAGPAAPASPDKSSYNLLNPTPDALLRDFDTDRPDKTNSPHTLDAGRIQIETGLLAYTRTEDAGVRTGNSTWADTMLRVGLTSWAEMQLEIPFYQMNSDKDLVLNKTDRNYGIGDLTAILKANVWGNDSGDTAGGLEVYVKSPTASRGLGNGQTEGGALFLLGMKLPGDFDCGINNGVGISDGAKGNHEAVVINSISVSHSIIGSLSGYAEFYSAVPTRQTGSWEGTVDLGLLLMIGKNLQLDAGINLGVTPAADDLQLFVGVSKRF